MRNFRGAAQGAARTGSRAITTGVGRCRQTTPRKADEETSEIMKRQLELRVDYQLAAIEAVCDPFRGQEICRSEFSVTLDPTDPQRRLGFHQHDLGIGNRLTLLDDEILKTLNDIQLHNRLRPSQRQAHLRMSSSKRATSNRPILWPPGELPPHSQPRSQSRQSTSVPTRSLVPAQLLSSLFGLGSICGHFRCGSQIPARLASRTGDDALA